MKTYFRQYRPFFLFLLKFFLTYGILTLCYRFYLGSFDENRFEVDGFSQLVGRQVRSVLDFFGYSAQLLPHEGQASLKLILNEKYVARIVEGCNALSVIILFAAFVIAFKGKWKHTIGFILAGSVAIHILNILRIALMSMALLRYPEYEPVLHGVIFPLFIYGVVFLLWVIWVNKFSSYAGKTA